MGKANPKAVIKVKDVPSGAPKENALKCPKCEGWVVPNCGQCTHCKGTPRFGEASLIQQNCEARKCSCGQEKSGGDSRVMMNGPLTSLTVQQQKTSTNSEVPEDEDDDDGLTCPLHQCQADFWFKSELQNHMKEAHDIADIEEFKRTENEKRAKEIQSKKVLEEMTRKRLESQQKRHNSEDGVTVIGAPKTFEKGSMSRVFNVQPSTSSSFGDESLTPVFRKSKSRVDSSSEVSEYEKIRLANIKEKEDMFKQLEINEAKEAATTPVAHVRRTAHPKRLLETDEKSPMERRKSVRIEDREAIDAAKEASLGEMMMMEKEPVAGKEEKEMQNTKAESLNELAEKDKDAESEEDLTCRENDCMESFWYMADLLEHMKVVHIV